MVTFFRKALGRTASSDQHMFAWFKLLCYNNQQINIPDGQSILGESRVTGRSYLSPEDMVSQS